MVQFSAVGKMVDAFGVHDLILPRDIHDAQKAVYPTSIARWHLVITGGTGRYTSKNLNSSVGLYA